jgi:hypothetical protein
VPQLEAQLRAASAAYIHATNTQLGVFRDVVIPERYNPLAPLARTICVSTLDICDPLKKDLIKAKTERTLISNSSSNGSSTSNPSQGILPPQAAPALHGPSMLGGPQPCGGGEVGRARNQLDPRLWGALHITATPHCHCINEDGEYTVHAPATATLAQRASHIHMDHFGPAPPQQPYHPGKRMGITQTQGQANMLSVMHYRCDDAGPYLPCRVCRGAGAYYRLEPAVIVIGMVAQ